MNDLEKNDVDINKLYQWKGQLDIKDIQENILMTVFIRLAGDADINRARTFAIRESAKFRKMLRSDDEERIAYILPIEALNEASLINLIKTLSIRDITNAALTEIRPAIPKEPEDGADLEKLEKYQEKIDEYPKERLKLLQEYLTKELEKIEERYKDSTLSELYKNYEELSINSMCETKMLDDFKDYCIFLCSYKDSEYKNKLFSEFEEYNNLPTDIKTQFREFYMSLEISVDNLKKSPEVTQ